MDEDVMKAIKPTENRLAVDRSSAAPTSIKPVRDPRLQWLLRLSPWAMLAALPVIAWPSNPLSIPGQFFFSTGFLTATLALFAFQVLMQHSASAFEVLWRRGAITHQKDDASQYGKFIRKIEDTLNSRGQWITAAICILLVISWYLYRFSSRFVETPILIVGILAEILIGILIGVMVWRMIVIGIQVWQLPKRFDLVLQIGHPDQCGGLEPLGNLCLWNALIIAMAGLFLGGWIAIGPSTSYRDLALLYEPIFKPLLAIPISFSLAVFLLPLWSTHQVMLTKKAEIEGLLDELTQSINREDRELLHSADKVDPAEGEKRLKKLELMREIYSQNRRIPTWPINIGVLSKFLAAQAIPVLSFLGVAEPVVSLANSLLQNISH